MSANGSPNASKAGIVTDANGQRSIPSSTRADGSKRKEIKIRPGYRPPEDVEVYRNRTADAFRTRGKAAGVPGAQAVSEEKAGTAASNKNAKRREARKRAKAAGEEADGDGENDGGPDADQIQNSKDGAGRAEGTAGAQAQAETEQQQADPEAEKEKKAKKLRKKLREAKDLQQKKDRGEGLLPEQLQKAIRINELIRELEQLGVGVEEDANPE